MPFHGHQHSTSASAQYDNTANQGSTASAIYQAAQALGSIGAPTGNLRVATAGAGGGPRDNQFPLVGNQSHLSGGGQTAAPAMSGLPGPGGLSQASAPGSAMSNNSQQLDTPRRAQTFNRQPEELHIPPANATMGQQHSRDQAAHHSYHSSQEYHGAGAPGINLHQATPQNSQYANPPMGLLLPGSLQPGQSQRPGPSSATTAPSTVPTMPQLSAQSQQHITPSRSSTVNQSHNYSRSSPAGLDQKYAPFATTPDNSKLASPLNQKYTSSQTPQGASSYSPLGLADIRPRADSGLSDGPYSANPYAHDEYASVPSNSNYLAPWAVYAFDWCKWPVQNGSSDAAGKMAIGSYLEDGHNFIQILDTQIVPETDTESAPESPLYGLEFTKTAEATHSYPVTRILWEPASSQKESTDLLATSGDHLRLWSLPSQASYNTSNSISRSSNAKDTPPQKLTPLALLSNSKSPEHTAPLTSLDWNTLSPSLIITSSIDTTCTIWDIPTLTAKTQLIAHDKEVFDVRFCANSVDVFVSCGADGSVRMFDLRSLEHSTIIYEPSEKKDGSSSSPGNVSPTTAQQTMSYAPPLLRLAASPHDAHLLATFSQDSNVIRILDVRQPGQALLELRGHAASINCIEWSPSRRGTLGSGGDDSLVLIWDLLNQSNAFVVAGTNGQAVSNSDNARGPAASWQCDYEVGNISWAPQSGLTSQGSDWLGVSGGRGVWGVSV
ncbi:WD40/YVTN repeat-like-containing domain [Lasallia pustulata]|uniref:WD40/YVTN repeat-like-containing domain n=1 Tax=Lasallia pustulata TaxID=136370 RepID=A0A1W5DAN1_9LECA|nr:WD40/YVTN repeat-like-containing domain [Lasallia pustulata]